MRVTAIIAVEYAFQSLTKFRHILAGDSIRNGLRSDKKLLPASSLLFQASPLVEGGACVSLVEQRRHVNPLSIVPFYLLFVLACRYLLASYFPSDQARGRVYRPIYRHRFFG